MKITVVMGFFLPMPPEAGGAIEKSWHRLSQEMVKRGHEVTIVSRRWKDWPKEEIINGVQHRRLRGYDHKSKLWLNLLCDFVWSWRVFFSLPRADIVILNTISLGCWLGVLRKSAGRVVAMPGRMPKGQFRLYPTPALIFVPSAPVKEAIIQERPKFAARIKTIGYPIDYRSLSQGTQQSSESEITITYIGRIHVEKGLDLLIRAAQLLARETVPAWKIIICGPSDILKGGSGAPYLTQLKTDAPSRVEFREPIFQESELQALYQQSDLFCYPSRAGDGETFGVSVAEAMAAGAVPVVSRLACFRDFLTPRKSGLDFDANAPDAAELLSDHLSILIKDPSLRHQLSQHAQSSVARFDFDTYVDNLLAEFEQLTHHPIQPPSSS